MAESLALALQLMTQADAQLLGIVALSLRVSFTACALGAVLGLLLGAWLAVARFPGHGVLVWAVNTLLALPSVVVGLAVYLLLSRSGPLGSWGLLFTPTAVADGIEPADPMIAMRGASYGVSYGRRHAP